LTDPSAFTPSSATAIGSDAGTEKAYCLALLKNPEETGIDGSRDAYLFLSPENLSAANPVVRGGMLLPIGDLTKFETLLDGSIPAAVRRPCAKGSFRWSASASRRV